jgi:hypothetical protein
MAQVRTCVVFSDVLRHDTPAGGSLPGVLLGDISGLPYGRPEQIARLHAFRADKPHQLFIMGKTFNHQAVIDTTVVFDLELI